MRAGERKRLDPRKNLVGFLVGFTQYAIDIWRVREIVNPLALTPMPHAPASLVGVADHRGEVVPVVDLRVQFECPAEVTRRTKWILLSMGEGTVGIVVDAVTGVFGTGETKLRAAPAVGSSHDRAILGVASNEADMVFVLDPAPFGELARPALRVAKEQAAPVPPKGARR